MPGWSAGPSGPLFTDATAVLAVDDGAGCGGRGRGACSPVPIVGGEDDRGPAARQNVVLGGPGVDQRLQVGAGAIGRLPDRLMQPERRLTVKTGDGRSDTATARRQVDGEQPPQRGGEDGMGDGEMLGDVRDGSTGDRRNASVTARCQARRRDAR